MIDVNIFNESFNKLPEYGTVQSSGFDLMADFSKTLKTEDFKGNGLYEFVDGELKLKPFGRVLIFTNNFIGLPNGYEVQVRSRSGLALKNGIMVLNSPGTIDSDYTGNIGVILYNSDPTSIFTVKQGDRIAQGVLCKYEQVNWVNVDDVSKLKEETSRGNGGFGHTGINQ